MSDNQPAAHVARREPPSVFFLETCVDICNTLFYDALAMKKTPKQKRSTLHVRVERSEKKKLAETAKRSGLSLSAWVRTTLIRAAGQYYGAPTHLVTDSGEKVEVADMGHPCGRGTEKMICVTDATGFLYLPTMANNSDHGLWDGTASAAVLRFRAGERGRK